MSISDLVVLFLSYLVEFVTSGPVVAMELKGSNAIQKLQTLLGPTDSATARNRAPMSIRAKFGTGMYEIMSVISLSHSQSIKPPIRDYQTFLLLFF